MKKWNLVIDVAECHNCNNCFISAKDEYVGNEFPGYSAPQPLHGHKWIDIKSRERGSFPFVDVAYVPTMCNHCDDAPCVKAGRGAVTKREDGIVIIDPVKARGRSDLVDACPYGAIWWNAELDLPQAWTFDAHLLDRGADAPRCVKACPTGAMRSFKVSDDEMRRITQDEGLEELAPEFKTRPRVLYKNLHRYNKEFVAGTVVAISNDVADCVSDATVELFDGTACIGSAVTDAFGEFKIDRLEPRPRALRLHVSHASFVPRDLEFMFDSHSIALAEIALQRAT
ncbi:MAG: oxidoreductase [Burkholderiales bacterium]|nr:oxidoreductase [Burkholderiales bacterium]